MFGIKHHVICPYYRSPSRKCHMWLWYFVTWLFYLQGNLAHEFTRYLAFVNFAICMWIKYIYTWLARSSLSTCEVHTSNVRKQLEGKRSRLRDTRILQWESADASVSDEQVWHIIDGGEEWQPPRIHTQNHTQTHIDTHSHPGLSGRHLFKQGVLMNRLCLSDSLSLTISTYYTCVQYVWPVIVCALRMGCLCLSVCVCSPLFPLLPQPARACPCHESHERLIDRLYMRRNATDCDCKWQIMMSSRHWMNPWVDRLI